MSKNTRYDFQKETDKQFLREASMMLQERVIQLELEVVQLKLLQAQDEEIKSKLTGELLVLRRRVFDSRQEKKDRLKELKKEKRKNKINLVHNKNENKEILTNNNTVIELEAKEIEHSVESCTCPHCGENELSELKNFFDESTEYDVNATYYLLKRHKRKKYKCQSCNRMTTAKGPPKIVQGGQFSVQMAVQIACDKFEFHLPLERQRVRMERAGLKVSVKTLFSLTQHLYNLLLPLGELNRLDIIKGGHVCIDESPMSFFNPSKDSGYVWSLSNHIGAYYQFEATRSGKVSEEMIKGFSGVVITDGYSGYNFLSELESVTHAYCWSHLRRYFFDALEENSIAGEVIDLIDQLYAIEHEAEDLTDLKFLREKKSRLIYNNIVAWVSENEGSYLRSTLTGKAITYFCNMKKGLSHFLSNENVPLDNNAAERRQRCPVMGRKNFLCFRSIDGADIGMFFYSIIESCKTNGIHPGNYLLEMALRALESKELETPYGYALRLKAKIQEKLMSELGGISPPGPS